MTTTHDWEALLADAGEEPLAPSAMRWIDTSLDAESTREQYWELIKQNDHYGTNQELTTKAATTDLATMNLIATNLGTDSDTGKPLQQYHLNNAFVRKFSTSDTRRFILLATMEESATGRNTVPRLNALTHSNDPALLNHPISTDEGLAAQHGIIRFMLTLRAYNHPTLSQKVLGHHDVQEQVYGWFSNRTILHYVLRNHHKAELIARTIIERETTNLKRIDQIINSDAPALAEGIL